ncbi:MAG: glycosyltransferase [Balneolaceae bacterium]|nr:glycosyltransferase [Balneolaceae bacterium]
MDSNEKKQWNSMTTSPFQILVSTVDGGIKEIEEFPAVVVNQVSSEEFLVDRANVFNYYEKGISKSRNRAIERATAELCLISDDDIIFKENADQKIIQAFEDNPLADIITFQVETPDGKPYKEYPRKRHWHDMQSLMNVSSVEIAFRRGKILQTDLFFDEDFGLGSTFPTGEEYIFLTDALKKGLNILYLPIPIVVHPKKDWVSVISDKRLYKAKGAMFYRVFGWLGIYYCFVISLKKGWRSEVNFFINFINNLKGIFSYRRLITQKTTIS